MQTAGCRLQVHVAGCRLQVAGAGCRLQVAGCGLRVAGCGLQVAGCRIILLDFSLGKSRVVSHAVSPDVCCRFRVQNKIRVFSMNLTAFCLKADFQPAVNKNEQAPIPSME